MFRSFCAWVFFLVVPLVLPMQARAYRTLTDLEDFEDAGDEPIAWRAFPIDFEVSEHPGDPVDGEATLAAVERAMGLWNEAMCTEGIFGEASQTDLAATNDGYNTVQWVTFGWAAIGDADAVATTEVIYEERGGHYALTEADILLNADTVQWSDEMLEHLDGVVAHELGHALGLAHPCESDGEDGAPRCDGDADMTLMHPLYDPSRVELAADDEDGACFLYPEGPADAPPPAASEPESDSVCTVSGPSSRSTPAAPLSLLLALTLVTAWRWRSR